MIEITTKRTLMEINDLVENCQPGSEANIQQPILDLLVSFHLECLSVLAENPYNIPDIFAKQITRTFVAMDDILNASVEAKCKLDMKDSKQTQQSS